MCIEKLKGVSEKMTQQTKKVHTVGAITIYQKPNTRGKRSNAEGFSKEYIIESGDTEALARAVEFDTCPAKYKDGYRAGKNFQYANCILGDIDNLHSDDPADWVTMEDVANVMSVVAYYYYPSQNHMKPKDGKEPRPKYHLIIPITETTSEKEYTSIMKRLIKAFPPLHFDEGVSGAAQLNFGVENAEVTYVDGEMNLTEFLTSIDVIPQGKRNNHMCSFAASQLKRYGDTDGTAYQAFINEAMKCSPLLDDDELKSIWNGAVAFYNETIKADLDYVTPESFNGTAKDDGANLTKTEMLLKLFYESGADVFHDDLKEPYAAIPRDSYTEILFMASKDFNMFLSRLYYKKVQKTIGVDSVKQVIMALSGEAIFGNPDPIPLSVRVAENGNSFWYDLTNSKWQAIKTTAEGWSVESEQPRQFKRYKHQMAQVIPNPDGDVRKILKYINLKSHITLFLCWLISCFIPKIPHPMPAVHGEKGAAKSTFCSLLKMLIDPSALATMTLQNDARSLAVNFQQHWFMPYDNVSYISEDTSDIICRGITGGGIQQRKLYTDADSYIFTFLRCFAVNGINNVVTRPDLLDRSILIELERVPEAERRELTDLLSEFETDRPYILGGIFNTLSKAMSIHPNVKLNKLPRMADFARWGYAIGEALGGEGDKFLSEYSENRDNQNMEAINANPVAFLIMEFMKCQSSWQGLVSGLLIELINIAPKHGIDPRSKSFPKQPNLLSRRLKDVKSNLEAVGITFDKHSDMRGTTIIINNANSYPYAPYHNTKIIGTGDTGGYGDEIVSIGDEGTES